MRDWQAMFDLPTKDLYSPWPAGKYILTGSDIDYMKVRPTFYLDPNESVRNIKRLPDEEYDDLLVNNILFLPLYDVNACNTILECIVRNTPVLTNRLPASEEYLGVNYPFFYETDDLFAAAKMAEDTDLIKETTEYLSNMDKTFLEPNSFIGSVINSEIYQNI